ncbi:MAG: cytochrome c3 family protein, partial [Candidatus Acidiferrales bacterium]
MRHFGDLKASKLLMILGLWSLPVLALAQGKPATADKAAPAGQEKSTQTTPATATPAATPSDYAGAQACKVCHAALYNGWEKSPHWKQTYQEGGIAKHGCEDCHGPAAFHVADPTDTSKLFLFEKASAKEIDARCLTCHASDTQHMNAINSIHAKNDVSCVSCHSPHHGKESDFLLIKSQPELCYSCHLAKKAEFDMPFHHRVN